MKAKEEEQRLKYLEFVQVATLHAVLCFSSLYEYAKERSGPLKPGVQTVEGTVKTVVAPVYDKFHGVPIELLRFIDRKVSTVLLNPFFCSCGVCRGYHPNPIHCSWLKRHILRN